MIEYKDLPEDLQDRLIKVAESDSFGTLNPATVFNGIRNSTGTIIKLAELYDVETSLVQDIKDLVERDSNIEYIMNLYENNPRFITEMITTISNNEDLSELTVEESLNTLSDENLNSMVTQLEILGKD